MAEPSSSPFVGLDKALLRSTKQPTPDSPSDNQPLPESPPRSPRPKRPRPSHAEPSGHLASTTDSNSASTLARYLGPTIEAIRKTVKTPGKEVSFVRLTPHEKAELAEIVYTYKRQGRKTSENEINRIAVNFIVEDYKTNGIDSILARVIDALLA
jgi:hypothetical protein